MQKVFDFLEQYVQWVAIGIAALLLAYGAYSYMPVVTQPVQVVMDGAPLGPGAVDPHIKEKADSLSARIQAATAPKFVVPSFVDAFRRELAGAGAKPAALPGYLVAFKPIRYPDGFDPTQVVQDPDKRGGNKVTALPVLPDPIMSVAPTTGFAQVVLPAVGAAAAPGGPPAAVPVAVPANAQATDTTWVRVSFQIAMSKIASAFQAAHVPPTSMGTAFLRAELLRQKELPGGAFGPEEVVANLPFLQFPRMPAEGAANFQEQRNYQSWANTNQSQIVQPEFFTVTAGSDPRYTKPAGSTTAVPTVAFNPETFPMPGQPGSDMSQLTPEQKAAVIAVRQRRQKEKDANKPQPPQGGGGRGPSPGGGRGGGGGGRGGGGGGRGGYQPIEPPPASDPGVPFPLLQVPGNGPDGGSRAGVTPPAGSPYPPQDGGFGPQGVPPAPSAVPTLIPFVPVTTPAPFNPIAVPTPLLDCWAYDVTALADSTYRYRVRYAMQNPIFGVQNGAADPALSQAFALVGGDKNPVWSDPITIAPLTHIFLAANPTPASTAVRFTVFRWQAGKQQRYTAIVAPGDSIGKVDGGTDYRTNWTLVEVRRDSSADKPYAVLMNADGTIRRQDFETDSTSPERKQLDAEVDGPPVAPPPGTPPPGSYPPGSYPPAGGYPGGGAGMGPGGLP